MKTHFKLTKAIFLLISAVVLTGVITANVITTLDNKNVNDAGEEVVSINDESADSELYLVSEEHYIDGNGSSIVDKVYIGEVIVNGEVVDPNEWWNSKK